MQSKLLYMEEHGNSPGCRGRCTRAQVCVAIGHSNSMWFTVFSSCPHLGQVRTGWQWRSARQLQTGTQFDKACHMKFLIFGTVLTFQACCDRLVVLGSLHASAGCSLSRRHFSSYPVLTEYILDFVWTQQKLSILKDLLMRILVIIKICSGAISVFLSIIN